MIMLSDYLKRKYGCKVYKLALSSGCGCPNRAPDKSGGCIFCDGAGAFAQSGDIDEQLANARKLISAKAGSKAKYIAYFQSFTNTYGNIAELERTYTRAAEPDDIAALSIATRPDCLSDEVIFMLERLIKIKPLWVELGLQTIHKKTAEYIRRGYELFEYDNAVRKLKLIGAEVVVHQIIGLPEESVRMMEETSDYIGKSGADGIKLHLLHIIRGTELEREWREGRIRTLELEEYIDILNRCLKRLPGNMVIHRLTGDGSKKDLLAPLWSADKKRVWNELQKKLWIFEK